MRRFAYESISPAGQLRPGHAVITWRIVAVLLALSYPLRVAALGFADVEYWAGAGTNRAGCVIDWHDGIRPHALVWGFRWNGQADSVDMLRAIAGRVLIRGGDSGGDPVTEFGADSRLFARLSRAAAPTAYTVFGLGYDVDGDGAVFHDGVEGETTETGFAEDADDHYREGRLTGRWQLWARTRGDDASARAASPAYVPLAEPRGLTNGAWDAWSFSPAPPAVTAPRAPGWPVAALHTPYATEVVAYDPGEGLYDFDWLSGDLFTNAVTALGRPTVDTTGDGTINVNDVVPVVPVYPAFRSFEVVMIGAGGSLTLAFDHRVLDSPANPYGVDFIIFGNERQQVAGGELWHNGDPNAMRVGSRCSQELGLVSVSQDGVAWFAFTNGVYADTFPPTLGRVYTPEAPTAELGDANEWWGAPTDPTLPVDPRLAAADWDGMSVAEVARRYRGSAGGRGFDIAPLPLSADEDTGLKWIRYVRIERSTTINPEVDAISDVAPATPLEQWRRQHFVWMGDPALESDGADADGDGTPNLFEYATGSDPTNAADHVRGVVSCTGGVFAIVCELADAAGDVRLRTRTTGDLRAPAWTTSNVVETVERVTTGTVSRLRYTARLPLRFPSGFAGLEVGYDE